jgi:DNA photolyase
MTLFLAADVTDVNRFEMIDLRDPDEHHRCSLYDFPPHHRSSLITHPSSDLIPVPPENFVVVEKYLDQDNAVFHNYSFRTMKRLFSSPQRSSFICLFLLVLCITMNPRTVVGLSSTPSTTKNGGGGGLIFYWFRQGDMRLHDNPALARAAAICSQTQSKLVPVFCFDPRIYGNQARGEFGSIKCGPRRAKFALESVADLRQSLEQKGSKLLVSTEKPEDLFQKLLQNPADGSRISAARTKLVYQEEVCSEEVAVANKVKKLFQSSEAIWGSTMYELKDLPYQEGLTDMPDTFTPFRNKVEKKCTILPPLPVPKDFGPFPTKEEMPAAAAYLSSLPTLQDMGYTHEQIDHANSQDPRGVMVFKGGETAALERLKDYIWDKDLLRKYFDTRNGMIGADYSSKFSPWLAHGNLSPRYIASQCKKYEEQRVANKSTYCRYQPVMTRLK